MTQQSPVAKRNLKDSQHLAVAAPKRAHDGGLEETVTRARGELLALQEPDGHWCFEFEAGCTVPAVVCSTSITSATMPTSPDGR